MAVRTFLSLWLVAGLLAAGCSRTDVSVEPEPPAEEEDQAVSPSTGTDRLHQSFAEATCTGPQSDRRLPQTTMTGKSVSELYRRVVRGWDAVRFVREGGTRLRYSATLQTDAGVIEIDLDHEAAPNHVRNFIVLARAGYYNGLVFDRVLHCESDEDALQRCEEIEAGCPLGTGEPGADSIGYRLKAEGSEAVPDEGAVGACPGLEGDSAACKFYITLGKVHQGGRTLFGKVTRGMDVARRIYLRPVILDDEEPGDRRRPLEPVVIHTVTIHTREVPATQDHVSRR